LPTTRHRREVELLRERSDAHELGALKMTARRRDAINDAVAAKRGRVDTLVG
jgi:hypothetical protein